MATSPRRAALSITRGNDSVAPSEQGHADDGDERDPDWRALGAAVHLQAHTRDGDDGETQQHESDSRDPGGAVLSLLNAFQGAAACLGGQLPQCNGTCHRLDHAVDSEGGTHRARGWGAYAGRIDDG